MPRVLHRLLSAAVIFAAALCFARAEPATETQSASGAISIGDCAMFGKQLADDFNNGKMDALFVRLDRTAFSQSVFDGFEFSAAERQGFERQILKSVVEGLTEKFQGFKNAKFLRVQEVNGQKQALLRLAASDFAITYLAFYVGKSGDGTLGWSDVFGYSTAETMVDGLRRFILFTSQGRLAKPRNSTEAAIFANGRRFVPKLTRIQRLFTRGEYDAAVRAIDQLPDELRTAQFVLCQRVQAAQPLGEEVYIKAIEAWEEVQPGDPSLNLVAIDAYLMRKNYSSVVRCVTALANQLNGTDGWLCFVRAYALELDRTPDAARAAAEEGMTVEPELPGNYTLLLKLALEEGDFPASVKILQSFEKNLPDEDPKRIIPETKNSEAFWKSPEFSAWLKIRQ